MATITCHWHPDRETGLRCGQCAKPICTDCMRHHPVGVRCKECAHEARLPTYRVSKGYLTRGIAAAVGMGLGGAIALGILASFVRLGILFLFLMAGLGYVIGEGVSAAVNRRRGRAYQYVAAGGALLATIPALGPLILFGGGLGTLFALAGVGAAVYTAVGRLAP